MNIKETSDQFQERIDSMNKLFDSKQQEERACKSRPVLKLVREFMIRRKAIFYGGMAQNEYLPKEMRFYGASDIPDYDVLSSNAEKLATDLADELVTKGYNFVTVKHALHEGTFKVSWDFEDVADVTKVSLSEERSMRRKAKRLRDGTLLCPLMLLKANAYIELAMPKSSMFRWAKVFERLKLLERAYPNPQQEPEWTRCEERRTNELVSKLHALLKRANLPLAGNPAIQYYMGLHFRADRYLEWCPRLEALSSNAEETLLGVRKLLDAEGAEYFVSEPNSNHLEEWNVFLGKSSKVHLLSIKHVRNRCYSVQRSSSGILYGSVFFVISMAYRALFEAPQIASIKHVLSALIMNIRVDDFKADCFGSVREMLSIKRSRVRKKMPVVFYDPQRKK